ncbi:hypothetical protein M378DRAFT_651941 [Amanita muscaria Koide BX008]|uniref:Uncharacterized protein n=1 Tax=Amanita muscaria (strain Koide BX008) TaxID=946122 RepID=A0A0C2WEX0_AMAMK|nr:hypothetical protein M378DRAFT_651941 [Amanita muscaria Koide BX008]
MSTVTFTLLGRRGDDTMVKFRAMHRVMASNCSPLIVQVLHRCITYDNSDANASSDYVGLRSKVIPNDFKVVKFGINTVIPVTKENVLQKVNFSSFCHLANEIREDEILMVFQLENFLLFELELYTAGIPRILKN